MRENYYDDEYPCQKFTHEHSGLPVSFRGKDENTGLFGHVRYFDLFVKYPRLLSCEILLNNTVHNFGDTLPIGDIFTLLIRNTRAPQNENGYANHLDQKT